MKTRDLKTIHAFARKTVANLAREWPEQAKTRERPLRSLVLTGSVLTLDWSPRHSDINVIAVYQKLEAGAVAELGPMIRRYASRLRSSPVLMDHEYLAAAPRFFPIEFLHWSGRHLTIWGEELLDQVEVDKGLLLDAVQREMIGKRHHLHRALISTQNNPAAFREFLRESIPHFMMIFRAWLEAIGTQAPDSDPEVIDLVARKTGVALDTFAALWEYRDLGRRILKSEFDAFQIGFVKELDALAFYLCSEPNAKKAMEKKTQDGQVENIEE